MQHGLQVIGMLIGGKDCRIVWYWMDEHSKLKLIIALCYAPFVQSRHKNRSADPELCCIAHGVIHFFCGKFMTCTV